MGFNKNSSPVQSVNGERGTVVIDADDISDTSTVKKFINTVNQTFEGVKTFTSTLNIDNSDVEGVAAIFEKSGNLATCEFRETTDNGYAAFDFFNNGTKRGTICSSGASSGFLGGAFWMSSRLSNPIHFCIDTVPKLTIGIDGNTRVIGYLTSKQSNVWAYISSSSATTVTTASTYYPIAGTFVNNMTDFSGATVVTPGIKYDGTLTRNFKITIQGQVETDSANVRVSLAIKKNGTLIAGSEITTLCRVADEPYHIGSIVMVELAEDDEIQLVTTSDGNGDEVTFENLQTLIEPISN